MSQLIQHLNDCRSKISFSVPEVPILSSLAPFSAIRTAEAAFKAAKRQFSEAIDNMIVEISSWRGDDPISKIYSEILTNKTVIDIPDLKLSELRQEWQERQRLRRPPGYKDSQKVDGGIGDFLIWKTILTLGQRLNKNVAFVTYDRKPDWMVRETYARPELIDEFRAASGGREVQLCTLADVLRATAAPKEIVEEVRVTEKSSSFAGHLTEIYMDPNNERRMIVVPMEVASFDYSRNNGIIDIDHGGRRFRLRFSKCSDQSIYIYKGLTNLRRIARVKSTAGASPLSFDAFDSSSDVYAISAGEGFLAENAQGEVLAARIDAIANDERGAPSDRVEFRFMSFPSDREIWLPRPMEA